MAIVKVSSLSKRYGPIQALKEVSFEVPAGSVFGILGPNGSGKTTLLGILMDILKANSGSYTLFGEEPGKEQRRKIGTLLETPNFYHYLSGRQNLTVAAQIKQRDPADITRVLDIVRLSDRQHSKFSTYSLGMKQRLAVASCLLGDPEVLVFDEPTNGLDPEGIAETRDLIRQLSRQGKTIIMASHLLDEVEKVCSHVAILRKGVLITQGHVDDILVSEDIVELASADLAALSAIAHSMEGVTEVKEFPGHIELLFPPGAAVPADINRLFFEKGLTLHHLRLRKRTLESKFFELTKNN